MTVYRITLWDKVARWHLIEDAARDLMTLYDTPLPTLTDGSPDTSSAAVMARGSDIQEAERRLRRALKTPLGSDAADRGGE